MSGFRPQIGAGLLDANTPKTPMLAGSLVMQGGWGVSQREQRVFGGVYPGIAGIYLRFRSFYPGVDDIYPKMNAGNSGVDAVHPGVAGN